MANFISRFLGLYNPYRLTSIVNVVFEVFIVCFFFKSIIRSKILLFPLTLILVFFLSHFLLIKTTFGINNFETLFFEVTKGYILQLNNYLFVFLFYIGFRSINNRQDLALKVFKILEIVFYINSVFVIIGLLTSLNYFKTYPNSDRFGVIGLINASTFTVYFYCLITVHLYRKYILDNKKYIPLIYTIVIGLILGKKGLLLFFALLLAYHIWHTIKMNKKVLLAVGFVAVILLITIKEKLFNLVFKAFPFWEDIYVNDGLFAFLTSYRNVKLEYTITQVDTNWTWLNYIFGGVVFPAYRTEWGIFDLYFFFGIVGLVVYTLFFKQLFKDLRIKQLFLLLLILIIAFFVGGFFVNVNLMMFYVILVFSFAPKTIIKAA